MFAQDALREVLKAKPDALGFNCGNCPEEVLELNTVFEQSGVQNVYKVFKPNAGLPDESGKYPLKPENFALQMRHALDKSFTIIGGCCGAGPEYITALKKKYSQ
jgi:5-methyltetrahydrofolate--homocysteine methyltransferase